MDAKSSKGLLLPCSGTWRQPGAALPRSTTWFALSCTFPPSCCRTVGATVDIPPFPTRADVNVFSRGPWPSPEPAEDPLRRRRRMPPIESTSSLPNMSERLQRIPLDRLNPHPRNANRMDEGRLEKLAHNINREGRYPPLIVRPDPWDPWAYRLLDGHQRVEALRRLGHEDALCFPGRVMTTPPFSSWPRSTDWKGRMSRHGGQSCCVTSPIAFRPTLWPLVLPDSGGPHQGHHHPPRRRQCGAPDGTEQSGGGVPVRSPATPFICRSAEG